MVPLVAGRWAGIGIHARNDVRIANCVRTHNHASNGEIFPVLIERSELESRLEISRSRLFAVVGCAQAQERPVQNSMGI